MTRYSLYGTQRYFDRRDELSGLRLDLRGYLKKHLAPTLLAHKKHGMPLFNLRIQAMSRPEISYRQDN